MRDSRVRNRRLWWRLPVPLIGVLLLFTAGSADADGARGVVHISAGITFTLIGLVLVLPWLVEATVGRLRGGPVPWQLATRGLQLRSSGAGRAVAGITIAVAGGIALQMYTLGIDDDFTTTTVQGSPRTGIGASAEFTGRDQARRMAEEFGATKGVKKAVVTVEASMSPVGARPGSDGITPSLTFAVGSCASLGEMAQLPSCSDGDVFRVTDSHDAGLDAALAEFGRPGTRLDFGDPEEPGAKASAETRWKVPGTARTVGSRRDPSGRYFGGVMVTPGAFDTARLPHALAIARFEVDHGMPDVTEQVRNAAYRIDPAMRVHSFRPVERDEAYENIRAGLFTAAALTMTLIAASLPLAGVGAAAIMAVTLLSMPALWRSMRTEGLRTE